MADKVKVAVRLRPMNKREIDLGATSIVDMDGTQTILHHPRSVSQGTAGSKENHPKHEPKTFAFDHCFWSVDENCTGKFVGQEAVFNHLGQDVLGRAFEGYNACIFAYGQTGSGKSFTMMGTADQKGIIPRLCDALFETIVSRESADLSFKVEVSYMEIYNEKVHDLLDPNSKVNLKVREHTILGPYVDGLSQLAVKSFADIENLMMEGNKSRTVAATNMNSESSRSHAVFTIIVTQTLSDLQSGVSGERVSKVSLVDLAGSERVSKTGAIGERLKEGSNINKSLTTLGLVIKALAEQSAGGSSKGGKAKFVPYRDSVLTWLLKDNLGGNSKTVMVATISPSADNYEETLSTLRYADSAKRIVNHAVINEDPNARIIRELREEVDHLRQQLLVAESLKAPDLKERLEESEKLMKEISKTWEEKLQETERIHKERHAALESMGICVESSGIKVEAGKSFLVNLNADPSLNELLVYYLKEQTRVGRADALVPQDIQLSGLGIQPEHCIIEVPSPAEVYVTPLQDACTCINGAIIQERTRARHGDRILWGNNHFFRLNCPRKEAKGVQKLEPELKADYDFAQQELMMQEMSNDPIKEAISHIEMQYENDKQAALEAQRLMYEEQMMSLRSQLASSTSSLSISSSGFGSSSWNRLAAASPSSGISVQDRLQKRIQQMAQERNSNYKHSLTQLREDICRANAYAREANFFAKELSRDVMYQVTLQIPASNLSPNRHRGKFVSEPAIMARDRHCSNRRQLFTMDDFENRLLAMRELSAEYKDKGPLLVDPSAALIGGDDSLLSASLSPFAINAEWHDLIGVANVFLDALFFDVKLEYPVAIISQHGEVAGRLLVELWKVEGNLSEMSPDSASVNSEEDQAETSGPAAGQLAASSPKHIVVKVAIKEGRGLPPALSNFVFCQYCFWGQSEPTVVAPKVDDPDGSSAPMTALAVAGAGPVIRFSSEREFTVRITEDFIDYLTDSALSIEVYGHRSGGNGDAPSSPLSLLPSSVMPASRSLADWWSEVTRKLQLWIEIHELNDAGEYQAVEVQPKPDVYCGGVFQIRQGHSRRLVVRVAAVPNSGTLPVICETITAVYVGSVCALSQLHKGLDSYQEDGLNELREHWSAALDKRRAYLEEKMQALASKQDKTDLEVDRERNLLEQWQSLIKERDAVSVPAPGSGVPGAPADSSTAFGMEQHIPVVFLNLNADDMSMSRESDDLVPLMESCRLAKETDDSPFFPLPIVQRDDSEVSATAVWDSTIHDSPHLNRVTPANERVYLIVKAYIRLSHPATLDIVLRKRICINVYKKQSLTDKLKKKISVMGGGNSSPVGRFLHVSEGLTACGITYDIVSNIPKASEELENRETLAKLAAESLETTGGETYMEKYLKSVAAVDSIIALDRLGQEAAIKESLLALGRPARRFNSSPNINAANSMWAYYAEQVAHLLPDIKEYMTSTKSSHEHSTPSLANKMMVRLSESFHDLSRYVMKPATITSTTEAKKPSSNAQADQSTPSHEAPGSGLVVESQSPSYDDRPAATEPASDQKAPGAASALSSAGCLLRTPDAVSSGYASLTNSAGAPGDDSMVSAAAHYEESTNGAAKPSEIHATASDATVEAVTAIDSCKYGVADLAASSPAIDSLPGDSASSLAAHGRPDEIGQLEEPPIAMSSGSRDVAGHEVAGDLQPERAACSASAETAALAADASGLARSTAQQLAAANAAGEDLALDERRSASALPSMATSLVEGGEEPPRKADVKPSPTCAAEADELLLGESSAVVATPSLTVTPTRGLGERPQQRVQQPLSRPAATRLEMQNDMYSVNALDELEALEGTMETLSDASGSESEEGEGDESGSNVRGAPPAGVLLPARSVAPGGTAGSNNIATSERFGESADVRTPRSGPQPRLASEADSSDVDTDDAVSQCSFGSHADLSQSAADSPLPSWIQVGTVVIVLSTKGEEPKTGTVKFVGETSFAPGPWIGVRLDGAHGKNDGSVRGIRYFTCEPHHGVFVRHDRLRVNRKKAMAAQLDAPVSGATGVRHSWSGPDTPMSATGSSNSAASATATDSAASSSSLSLLGQDGNSAASLLAPTAVSVGGGLLPPLGRMSASLSSSYDGSGLGTGGPLAASGAASKAASVPAASAAAGERIAPVAKRTTASPSLPSTEGSIGSAGAGTPPPRASSSKSNTPSAAAAAASPQAKSGSGDGTPSFMKATAASSSKKK